ncbi:MAG: LolA family protein, partial [Armatimonadota bacterium]
MSPHSIGKRKEPQRRVLRIGFLISAIGILGCAISSAFAEPDPLEIMRNVVRARGNVTFEADRTVHIINNGKTVRALHQKVYRDTGHKERIETFTSGQSKSHVVVCDGRQMWEYWPSRNLVINHPSAPGGASDGDVQNCINVLYQGMSLAYGGKDTVAQRPVHTVIIRNKNDKLVRKSWIDTGKYVELKTEKYYGGGHPYIRAEVTRIRYHSGLDGTLFDFKAPPQAKTKQVPTPP